MLRENIILVCLVDMSHSILYTILSKEHEIFHGASNLIKVSLLRLQKNQKMVTINQLSYWMSVVSNL